MTENFKISTQDYYQKKASFYTFSSIPYDCVSGADNLNFAETALRKM